MEENDEITRFVINVVLTVTCVVVIQSMYLIMVSWMKRRLLRKKGNIYIAIQLMLDGENEDEKNKITELTISELDEEVCRIAKRSQILKSTGRSILRSKLESIHKYYLQAIKEDLFDKEKSKYSV